jgi:hypothetical protein
MRRMFVVGVVAGLSAFGLALGSGPVGAETVTIGDAIQPNGFCSGNADFLQFQATPSYVVPAGQWNLVSWSTFAGESPGDLQVEVWRPTATPGTFELVGIGPVVTTTASVLNTFPVSPPIVVQGGDILGFRNLTKDYGCGGGSGDPGSEIFGAVSPTAPVPGELRPLSPQLGVQISASATLERVALEGDITVTKQVVGTPPAGTTFKVKVDCDGEQDDKTLTFGETGGTKSFERSSSGPLECEVSEPDSGGATSVEFACDADKNAECDNHDSFTLFDDPSKDDSSVEITVTNKFPAAAAAPVAVAVAPKFTG